MLHQVCGEGSLKSGNETTKKKLYSVDACFYASDSETFRAALSNINFLTVQLHRERQQHCVFSFRTVGGTWLSLSMYMF